jgi:uroporphyrinogen-III synthase
MRVVVTRPAAEAETWCRQLRQETFDALPLPLIAIGPLDETGRAALRSAWQSLGEQKIVMFVSAAAVQHFFDESPPGTPWPAGTRAWATGPGTTTVLLRHGVPAGSIDTPPADTAQLDSESLWAAAGEQVLGGDRVLIVRGSQRDRDDPAQAGHGRSWLADRLASAGAVVTQLAAYRRGSPRWTPAEAAAAAAMAGAGTVWIFSNSEAIGHLLGLLADVAPALRRGTAVATHPRIAATARAAGFARVEVAPAGLQGLAGLLRGLQAESGR